MILGRVGSYRIEKKGACLLILRDQSLAVLKGVCFLIVFLFFVWLIVLYSSFNFHASIVLHLPVIWLCLGIGFAALSLILLAAWAYREEFFISDQTIRWHNTWQRKEKGVPRDCVSKWLAIDRSWTDSSDHTLQLVSHDGKLLGYPFLFLRTDHRDRFLEILSSVFPMDVEYLER